jgi:rare lipoprotein A
MGRYGLAAGLVARVSVIAGCCLALAHCGKVPGSVDPKYGVSSSPRVVKLGDPVPKGGGYYRVGQPYTIGGQSYSPEENPQYSAEGIASWYGVDFHGRQTANREIYDMNSISGAHPTLPIPSYARVTNLGNGRSLIVRVNDRGPYHQGRVIDVSARAAQLLGFHNAGTARVRVDYVGRASLEGSDDAKLAETLRRGTPAPGPAETRVATAGRSFAPQSSHAPVAMRERVPTPAERPFDLGHEDRSSRTASRAPAEASAVARRPLPQQSGPSRRTNSAGGQTRQPEVASISNFEARFAPVLHAPASVRNDRLSADASTAAGPPGTAVVTGRGLY